MSSQTQEMPPPQLEGLSIALFTHAPLPASRSLEAWEAPRLWLSVV